MMEEALLKIFLICNFGKLYPPTRPKKKLIKLFPKLSSLTFSTKQMRRLNQKNNGPPHLKRCGLKQALVFRLFKRPHLKRCGFTFENKKGSEYSIIDWLPFLVLFFVVIGGFVVSFLWLAGEKYVSGEGGEISVISLDTDPVLAQSFFGALNSNVEGKSIFNLVRERLNDYSEIKSSHSGKGSLIEVYGIEGLSEIKVIKADVEGFDKDAVAKLGVDNQIFSGEIVKELKKRCDRFYLLIPQGLINENGLLAGENVLGRDVFTSNEAEFADFGDVYSFRMYYENYGFLIKYRQLKEC